MSWIQAWARAWVMDMRSSGLVRTRFQIKLAPRRGESQTGAGYD